MDPQREMKEDKKRLAEMEKQFRNLSESHKRLQREVFGDSARASYDNEQNIKEAAKYLLSLK
jgi:septal ring factor EnvC (AmiA/AmiB activator)